MRSIAYDGVAAITTDEVATALMGLALTVARYGVYELVTVPVLVEGRTEELTLMLGPTIHLSAVTVPVGSTEGLDGSAEALSRMEERRRSISDPLLWADESSISLRAVAEP